MDFSEKKQKWRHILNGTFLCYKKVETKGLHRGKEDLNALIKLYSFNWCNFSYKRKSLQTFVTRDNPRTQTKNRIGRSPRDTGDAPESRSQHDLQTLQDNGSQEQIL